MNYKLNSGRQEIGPVAIGLAWVVVIAVGAGSLVAGAAILDALLAGWWFW